MPPKRSRPRILPPPVRSELKLPLAAAAAVLHGAPRKGDAPSMDELVKAIVRVHSRVPADARTAESLGREREGSGIVIDNNGLVLTIGYLIVEATEVEIIFNNRRMPAAIEGYDHDSGFGLLRTFDPVPVLPLAFGKSAELREREAVIIASFGGAQMSAPAYVVAKREFAGNWEYLLDEAIFTAPPHPAWSGAALLNNAGRLVGVGSLIVGDATGGNLRFPGNMFVPIDRLRSILGDLIMDGRASGPGHPWIGLATDEVEGKLVVTRVTPDGPADRAGVQQGDVIAGVRGEAPKDLVDFYRKIWAQGPAGATVALDIVQGMQLRRLEIRSIHRMDHLKHARLRDIS